MHAAESAIAGHAVRARWPAHITGNCFVSFVSDIPLGSSPIRIALTISGARSVLYAATAAIIISPIVRLG